MKQSASIGMKKGTKVCLGRFPHQPCHSDWEQSGRAPLSCSYSTRGAPQLAPGAEEQLYWPSWAGPISRKLLWSWWDTTTPVPHRLSQKDVCGIMSSSYSEDAWGGWKSLSRKSLRQPCSSFPPLHSCAQPSTVTKALYNTFLIPFWVCSHTHCCVRLDTTSSSTHNGKKT